jgi:hypothetical protein
MINPDAISTALVALLADTPAVAAVAPGGVAAYQDVFPGEGNIRQAVYQMPVGSILVAYMGLSPRKLPGGWLQFSHSFSLYLRAKEGGSYGAMVAAVVNGVPATLGEGSPPLPLLRTHVVAGCDPMDLDLPSARRQVLLLSETATLDYFEMSLTFVENGV